jgi:hypothetical protein
MMMRADEKKLRPRTTQFMRSDLRTKQSMRTDDKKLHMKTTQFMRTDQNKL